MDIKVAFVFDKKNTWIFDFFNSHKFDMENYSFSYLFDMSEVCDFDIVILLGQTKIFPNDFLKRNKLNLVVHESDLPRGKGFAPVQWQLLKGSSEITVSLIEAAEKFDSGDILNQSTIKFDGTELYDEIREKQATGSIEIISDFLKSYPNISRTKQTGSESFYPKRTLDDGELDISKTIEENFNLLRVGNNDDWPSFFYHKGVKYILKIFKEKK
tara:strand:+ start:425 stop:1066 length:642 start_codon:yes stop_codon:yes gene_type:complete